MWYGNMGNSQTESFGNDGHMLRSSFGHYSSGHTIFWPEQELCLVDCSDTLSAHALRYAQKKPFSNRR